MIKTKEQKQAPEKQWKIRLTIKNKKEKIFIFFYEI